jgi:peptide/nickel transport system substrate-binding protein
LDPKNKSQSAGVLGACTSAGIKKVDATTIKFELTRADANFPYVVSKASYGLCILKKGTNGGAPWIKKMIGAGPWIMVSHKLNEKTVFKKNPNYYDKARIPKFDTMEQIQYVSASTAVPALKTGKIDAIGLILAKDATAVGNTGFYEFRIPTCGGLHMHMRCDAGPFIDKRVREALALCIDRQAFVTGVLGGAAEVANDSVMDSFKATVDTTVPQRKKDLVAAKALMAAAGVPNGFKVDLNTWKRDDNDKFAQFVKTSAKEIGIDITLKIDGSDGGATVFYTYKPGTSVKGVIPENNGSWLACELGVAEWGGRATPDPYLNREWRSDGDWNAAHVNDKDIDAGVDLWNNATTLEKKKAASSAIQKASLAATPYIIAYNETRISVISNKVKNLEFNSLGMIEAGKATPA